jgi:hypothetical protein
MQGSAFLGEQEAEPRAYVHGFRDRMDERYDLLRMVRDEKYKYIRNFLPQMPYFHHQYIGYMYEMPTMRDWQALADAGALAGPAANWMTLSKPVEELYDVEVDPFEVNNLALDPEYRETLDRLRGELRRWQAEIIDLGLLHEADMRTRFGPGSPYDGARRDREGYPIDRILDAAELAGRGDPSDVATLASLLDDADPGIRWWGATGLAIRGASSLPVSGRLVAALDDPSPWVRVAAADALCRLDRTGEAVPALILALGDANDWVRLAAINVLDRLDDRAAGAGPSLRAALEDANPYVVRVAEHAVKAFDDAE